MIQNWRKREQKLAGDFGGGRMEAWLPEEVFLRMLRLERKRSERSGKPFMLMLLDLSRLLQNSSRERVLRGVSSALCETARETDITGWHEVDCSVGVIFTEIGQEKNGNVDVIRSKADAALRAHLTPEMARLIRLSTFVFPEEWDGRDLQDHLKKALYPDLPQTSKSKRVYHGLKRTVDIAGSLAALILAAPLFLAIAAAIKLTSKGSVLYRQERLGQYGVPFPCLKFRTMHANNDPTIHKQFVTNLISGKMPENGKDGVVFKITDDPRVTGIGRFLRRTSLDEFPQFLNVLRGEMSLVGPRPPVTYELNQYDTWHRRRILEAKPGITGLWQVEGRSRTTFDEMVRLDLRYARAQSLWLDLRILLKTPWAVISSKGAY